MNSNNIDLILYKYTSFINFNISNNLKAYYEIQRIKNNEKYNSLSSDRFIMNLFETLYIQSLLERIE